MASRTPETGDFVAKEDFLYAMTPRFETSTRQTTLGKPIVLSGRGAHTDHPALLRLYPAEAGAGVVFTLIDGDRQIPAHWSKVCATQLRTEISSGSARVATIEHLMAALFGMGVDNALIELDGPEVPAMDGSARDFVAAIREAGLVRLKAPRRAIKITQTVRVTDGAGWAELAPLPRNQLDLDVEIAFAGAIGRQRLSLTLSPDAFERELASARSFGFVQDAERLWRQGLALGASLDNSLILDGDRVLNPQGMRFRDEPARHKMLDVIGDLALAGAPILGSFRSYRGGHALNFALVERLMTNPSTFVLVGDRGRAGERAGIEASER
ncbi:MAG: UDP-3-O-acyl-N-acetylglucosamine deacetylase [Methylocystis sp.]